MLRQAAPFVLLMLLLLYQLSAAIIKVSVSQYKTKASRQLECCCVQSDIHILSLSRYCGCGVRCSFTSWRAYDRFFTLPCFLQIQ